jgi:hypothetical protein
MDTKFRDITFVKFRPISTDKPTPAQVLSELQYHNSYKITVARISLHFSRWAVGPAG